MIEFPDYVQRVCQEDEENNCMLEYEFKVNIYILSSQQLKKGHFYLSVQELQTGPEFPCEVARLSYNTNCNRFKNVYPCEDARLVIQRLIVFILQMTTLE